MLCVRRGVLSGDSVGRQRRLTPPHAWSMEGKFWTLSD